jgi:hypothetical protein
VHKEIFEQGEKTMDNKKPKHFFIFKILGILGILLGILGVILTITGFNDFESNRFMIGTMLTPFALFIGISCTIIGFRPEIEKNNIQTTRYIQEENKEELKDIANNSADIMENAVSQTASAVKNGLKENTLFCKYCGEKIDADSKFCKHCGKEQ